MSRPPLGYARPQSVAPGEPFALHLSAARGAVDVEIARPGAKREIVWRRDGVAAGDHAIPQDAVANGCRWPAALSVETAGWASGYYEISLDPQVSDPAARAASAAFVVVRPPAESARRILLALSTHTWHAYNDVGGGNFYTGEPRASLERPLAAGFLSRPEEPGHRVAATAGPDPRMRAHVAYQRKYALSGVCGAAGWWNWERVFVVWAEANGYALDFATNADLEAQPGLLNRYALLLSIGHDEYWTWGMRDAVESFIARGGNVAFFSGNTCYWQVRLEDGGRTLVGYKQRFEKDPLHGTARGREVTSIWSDHSIGRPENTLTGVSFVRGGYARIGKRSPAGAGGYLVQRPEHWLFAGTGLAYGDVLGAAGVVVGYECDGCELALRDGRPVATGADGTPESFEVLATAPAEPFDRAAALLPIPAGDLSEVEFNAWRVFGEITPATLARVSHGHAVLGCYTRGGTVVTTGCTDWSYGLAARDRQVEHVTRNVLDRLSTR